jgi:capsular polysaccharide biosynthesis protein/Mrp family chromosome partitioning ATPase
MAALEPRNQHAVAEPRSISLVDYWLIFRRRWVLVLVMTLLGAALAFGYTKAVSAKYSATSQVLVAPVTQGPLNTPAQASLLVNMSTEQAIAQSAPVLAEAAKLIHIRLAELQALASKRLTVAVPTTSDVLQITWVAKTPQKAQAGANAFATAYLMYRHAYLAGQIGTVESVLRKQIGVLQSSTAHVSARLSKVRATSVEGQALSTKLRQLNGQLYNANKQLAALSTYNDSGGKVIPSALPLSTTGLKRSVILAMGALLGLLIGLVAAFIQDLLDDRVRDSEQLERTLGAATLTVLPGAAPGRTRLGKSDQRGESRLATVTDPGSSADEAVGVLRATLVAMGTRHDTRTVLMAGADASVSSGRIVAELGVALARSGRRVLLVGADTRSAVLPQIFHLRNDIGLSDLLVGTVVPAEELIRQPRKAVGVELPQAVSDRLHVLPAGPNLPPAPSLLDSAAMVGLLKSQREAYDFVLLESPPATAAAADVLALAPQVDGVMVIARAAITRCRTLKEIRRGLDRAGARMIGGLLIVGGRAGRYWQAPMAPDPQVPEASQERAKEVRPRKPEHAVPHFSAPRTPGRRRETTAVRASRAFPEGCR